MTKHDVTKVTEHISLSDNDIWTEAAFRRCFVKKNVLKNFSKFAGKNLFQSLFSYKISGLSLARLLKKRLWHRYFPMNFSKFLRTPFFKEHI